MSISVMGLARCKECNCVFIWTIDNAPFIDSEIVGTCSSCLNHEKHVCVDERDHE